MLNATPVGTFTVPPAGIRVILETYKSHPASVTWGRVGNVALLFSSCTGTVTVVAEEACGA